MSKKVIVNVYAAGKAIKKAVREALIILMELFYSFTIAYFIGKWAIDYAYSVRRYKAYGGEYVLIVGVFLISFHGMHIFFKFIRR